MFIALNLPILAKKKMLASEMIVEQACLQWLNVPTPERNLRDAKASALLESAQEACVGKSLHNIEFCIYDVVATGDVGMA